MYIIRCECGAGQCSSGWYDKRECLNRMVTVSWTRCKLYDEGQYNVHTYVHILCGETHRDVYGVNDMEQSNKCDRCC